MFDTRDLHSVQRSRFTNTYTETTMAGAPSRLQTGLVLLLLAIAGGVFVAYHKPNFIPKNGVNVTDDSSELNEQRMASDGTCEATEEMYKKTENKEREFKEADTVVENDAVETEDAVEEDKDENDVVTARPEEVSDDEECQDHHEKCEEWASIGECKTNPAYMLSKKGCRKSCLVCGTM